MSIHVIALKKNYRPATALRRIRKTKAVITGAIRKADTVLAIPADDPIWAIYDGFIEEFRRQDCEAVGSDDD